VQQRLASGRRVYLRAASPNAFRTHIAKGRARRCGPG
jgi:hypothetical protein